VTNLEAALPTKTLTSARWTIYFAFVYNGTSMGLFVSRLPDIRNYFGLTNAQLGLVTFVGSLGIFFAMKPAGHWAAKYGSSRVLVHATWAYGLSTILLGLLLSVPWLIATLFLTGFLVAVHDIAMNSHATAIERLSKKSMMNSFHARFSLGGLVGAAIGGTFSELEISYLTQALMLAAVSLAVVPVLNKFLLPPETDIHVEEPKPKADRERPHIFYWLGLLGFAASVCEGAAADWGAILLRDTWQVSPFISTIPFIAFSAAMVIGRLLGDRITDRFSRETVVRVGGYIAGIGLATGLIIGKPIGVTLGWIFLGVGVSVIIPSLFSAAGEIARNRFAGHIAPSQAVAIVGGVSYAGFLVGAPLLGLLSDYLTLRWSLLVPAGAAIVMGIFAKLVRSNS
jgi:MFS family permease